MNKITIPFLPQFEKPMLESRKTGTSCTRRYGWRGDYFEAFGRIFILTDVVYMRLGTVATHHYKEEGFAAPEGFINIWKKLHPRATFSLSKRVYFHRFILQTLALPPFHVHEFLYPYHDCAICHCILDAEEPAEALV